MPVGSRSAGGRVPVGDRDVAAQCSYRHLSDELADASEAALAAAGSDPRRRLRACVGAGFAPPFLDPARLTARVALRSLATTTRRLRAVHSALYRRYHAKLAGFVDAPAPGIGTDDRWCGCCRPCSTGFWLERSAGDRSYDPDRRSPPAWR